MSSGHTRIIMYDALKSNGNDVIKSKGWKEAEIGNRKCGRGTIKIKFIGKIQH